MPTALVTGVTGQDGAYLSQLLLSKGYRVIGLMRRSASSDVIGERLRWLGILKDVELVDGNLTDLSSLIRVLTVYKPEGSLQPGRPILRGGVLAAAALDRQRHRPGRRERAEAVRLVQPEARFYQASSSEMFGLIRSRSRAKKRRSTRARPTRRPSCTRIG